MAASGGDRYMGGHSTAYSPFVQQPQKDKSRSARVALALILTLALPPIGILYAWRAAVFPTAGLVALTAFGCLVLGGIFYVTTPNAAPQPIQPTPASPQRITVASDTDVTTALSNIDALLGIDEEALQPAPTDPALQVEAERQEAILDMIVYAVSQDAKYYHVASMCRDQLNPRQLTIREAVSEGLQPCSRCQPPRL